MLTRLKEVRAAPSLEKLAVPTSEMPNMVAVTLPPIVTDVPSRSIRNEPVSVGQPPHNPVETEPPPSR